MGIDASVAQQLTRCGEPWCGRCQGTFSSGRAATLVQVAKEVGEKHPEEELVFALTDAFVGSEFEESADFSLFEVMEILGVEYVVVRGQLIGRATKSIPFQVHQDEEVLLVLRTISVSLHSFAEQLYALLREACVRDRPALFGVFLSARHRTVLRIAPLNAESRCAKCQSPVPTGLEELLSAGAPCSRCGGTALDPEHPHALCDHCHGLAIVLPVHRWRLGQILLPDPELTGRTLVQALEGCQDGLSDLVRERLQILCEGGLGDLPLVLPRYLLSHGESVLLELVRSALVDSCNLQIILAECDSLFTIPRDRLVLRRLLEQLVRRRIGATLFGNARSPDTEAESNPISEAPGVAFSAEQSPTRGSDREMPDDRFTVKIAEGRGWRAGEILLQRGALHQVAGPIGAGKSTLLMNLFYALYEEQNSISAKAHFISWHSMHTSSAPRELGREDRVEALSLMQAANLQRAFARLIAAGKDARLSGVDARQIEDVLTRGEALRTPIPLSFHGVSLPEIAALDSEQLRDLTTVDRDTAELLDALIECGVGSIPLNTPCAELSAGERSACKIALWMAKSSSAQRTNLARRKKARSTGEAWSQQILLLDHPFLGTSLAESKLIEWLFERILGNGATIVATGNEEILTRVASWRHECNRLTSVVVSHSCGQKKLLL